MVGGMRRNELVGKYILGRLSTEHVKLLTAFLRSLPQILSMQTA